MAEALEPPFDRPDQHFNTLPGWTWVGTYGGYYLQADLLTGFEHGFFSRQWHGRSPQELVAFLSAGVSIHRLQQVHGAVVHPADQVPADPWPEGDGLVSTAGGQSLWVCGADCTPVLLADPVQGRVAACHAGWRGVAARILPSAVAELVARGSRLQDLRVALGPAIAGERYQVEQAVADQVAAALPATAAEPLARTMAEPLTPEALEAAGVVQPDPEPGRCRLDIRQAAVLQLRLAGLVTDQLAVCPLCTHAEPLLFHSWRRDQVKAVQWSGIVSQA